MASAKRSLNITLTDVFTLYARKLPKSRDTYPIYLYPHTHFELAILDRRLLLDSLFIHRLTGKKVHAAQAVAPVRSPPLFSDEKKAGSSILIY